MDDSASPSKGACGAAAMSSPAPSPARSNASVLESSSPGVMFNRSGLPVALRLEDCLGSSGRPVITAASELRYARMELAPMSSRSARVWFTRPVQSAWLRAFLALSSRSRASLRKLFIVPHLSQPLLPARPHPVADLRHVLAVFADIAPVLDQGVTELLLDVSGPGRKSRHAFDGLGREMIAVEPRFILSEEISSSSPRADRTGPGASSDLRGGSSPSTSLAPVT